MVLLLWLSHYSKEIPNQITLVKLSKLDKMTVSQALKKLGTQNLVKRAEHVSDTRAKGVWLTEQGKVLIHQLVPMIEKIGAQFFNPLLAEEQQSLRYFLQKLTQ
jgi:DNA-binding MarR family transcriptional regulator